MTLPNPPETRQRPADATLPALAARLKHTFGDPKLLQLALTHRSFSSSHNERLEFLGDSVLNLAVSHLLYERLAALPEGDLSRVRANLVKQETLHQIALRLMLSPLLRLGEGEARSGGSQRPSILADALEAVIGADGRVDKVKVLRGHPLLNDSAMDAVKQWVYNPTTLNGVAVPVIMTVTVNFKLGAE